MRKILTGLLALSMAMGWLMSCASVQGTLIIPVMFPNAEQAGMTTCALDDTPVIFVDSRNLNNPRMPAVIKHEKVHVAQMTRYGGCKATQARYNSDRDFALQMEAEAYCADLRYLMETDSTAVREVMLQNISLALATLYPIGKTPIEIRRHLKC